MNNKLLKSLVVILTLITTPVYAIEAPKVTVAPIIDGLSNDESWNKANWHPLDQHILGVMPTAEDFNGRFKITWDENRLYILVEITDDVLFDQHADPLHLYWDDDCLEIFIDENKSGGNHQFDFNAFAYHVALDNQAVDIGPNNADGSTQFVLLNDHIHSKWQRSALSPHKIIWEVSLAVYDDKFTLASSQTNNELKTLPVKLYEGKKLGFMLAYCDNDGSKEREHFMGSVNIAPVNGDKNLGYIDAGVFGSLTLVK